MSVKQVPVAEKRPRRRESAEVRRAQVVAAARSCFASAGFQATGVDDIADKAGVSVGLLYRVFRSKREIIEAIVTDEIAGQVERAYQIIATGKESGINERMALEAFEGDTVAFEDFALTFEMAAEACRDIALRDFLRKQRAEHRSALIERLAREGWERDTVHQQLKRLDALGAAASGLLIQMISDPDIRPSELLVA